jgi:hypothetical protein
MSDEQKITQGLACPKCGGVVPVPEGQVIVKCPYCDLRSYVRGVRGLQRYQVPLRVTRAQAVQALQQFLGSKMAIAAGAAKQSKLSEAFVVYLPFWSAWARLLGWVLGQKRVSSGKHTHYRPREIQFMEAVNWTGAACDVGEFGASQVALTNRPLEPFNPAVLHATGLVFEPVGSMSAARSAAATDFEKRVEARGNLERLGQLFVRYVRQRFGLVYYPLWVLRYLYRGRTFQVALDGYTGQVLYGKAPGNTLYRSLMLVGGMALGAFLAVDVSALLFYGGLQSGSKGLPMLLVFGIFLLAAGCGCMSAAYRAFRYGEQYEYRLGSKSVTDFRPLGLLASNKDAGKWTNQLN